MQRTIVYVGMVIFLCLFHWFWAVALDSFFDSCHLKYEISMLRNTNDFHSTISLARIFRQFLKLVSSLSNRICFLHAGFGKLFSDSTSFSVAGGYMKNNTISFSRCLSETSIFFCFYKLSCYFFWSSEIANIFILCAIIW